MDDGNTLDGIVEANFQIAFEHLHFENEVAEGAFGKIFKGDYFGTPVAIKKFMESGYPEDDQKYIAREVATLKGIRHPCIVNFMGVCSHSSGVYIVTEWIPNGDLTNLLKNVSVEISWKDRVQMLMDAAIAMRYLHAHNIIHRDLKSENLLLTENGRIKICDLGFARTTKKLTRTMSVAGTELYMAPEVMLGEDYDEKCDVFSFGIVIFEVICRHPPPKRSIETRYGFPSGLLTQYMPPDCPPDLALLTMDCTQYEKEGRPSFEDIYKDLKTLYDELEAEEAAAFVNNSQEMARLEQQRAERFAKEQEERERQQQEEKDRREQEERDQKARIVKEKREKELREREKQKKKLQEAEDLKKKQEEDEQRAKERENQLRAQLEKEVMEKLEQEKKAIREQFEKEYAQREKEREERERKEREEREEREQLERAEIERRARDEVILNLTSPRSRNSKAKSVSSSPSLVKEALKKEAENINAEQKKERSRSWALRSRKSNLQFKQALNEEATRSMSAEGEDMHKESEDKKDEKKGRRRSWAPAKLFEEKEKKKKAKEEKKKREDEEKKKKKEEKRKKKVEKKMEKEEKKIEKDNAKMQQQRSRSASMATVTIPSPKSGPASYPLAAIVEEEHPFG